MNNGPTHAKPGAGAPGFARLLWSAFASLPYRIGLAGANARGSFSPVTLAGEGGRAALLWGGPQ